MEQDIGRPTAYSILNTELADTLTVCDTKPGRVAAFAEELKHVTASTGLNVEINACDKDEQVAGADVSVGNRKHRITESCRG